MKRVFLVLMLVSTLASCRKDFDMEVWEVSDQMVMTGTLFGGQVECMQIKTPGSQNWEPNCTAIEGFNYERGHTYAIRVRIYIIKDPPQDSSNRRYVLDKVLRKD
jgi:hypothetical protein